ncbi:protein phosphatase 2C 73 [Seminavis robusta]|uniref:Protein phosphatase 2C 73 n=1 Tax=Seminavis robusta TaxID=568900 RepID=A0A9N8HHA2_9STRA|nr:protein phosphatase 2C 73 [Seminavis robusta]|eukprot:Sro438_g142990.1 protein phosphatase 2C 73 (319) ;mRNA; r:19825-20781
MRPQKVNQDALFHATLATSNNRLYTCVGVLDGHGLKGHIVSQFLAQQLPYHLQSHLQDLLGETLTIVQTPTGSDFDTTATTPIDYTELEAKLKAQSGLSQQELLYHETEPIHHQAMIRAFHSVHWAATQDTQVPAGRNGATCVTILWDHQDNMMHVAHVGDSRVIQVMNDNSNNSQHSVEPLSVETTVKVDTERERIEAGEGSIRGTNVFYGPVGIAMTRSLGNAVMLRAGVVPTPIVKTFPAPTISNSNSFLVLATDGIWDVLPNDAVARLVLEHSQNMQHACKSLAAEARRKWVGDLPIVDEEKVDDITCVVIRPV